MKGEALEDTAQRIAETGREALADRLREAFEEAATAHADVLELDTEKVEKMIEHAVDLADGLQWRRALAVAATGELGIGLGEALGHPAVERAQKIVGAPSYEEALAAIEKGQPPASGSRAPEGEAGGAAGKGKAAAGGTAGKGKGKGKAAAEAGAAGEEAASPGPEAAPASTRERLHVVVDVVHLDGLPELEGEGELELHFSGDGLMIVRVSDRSTLARLAWSELQGIGVDSRRGRVWRRHASRVVVDVKGHQGRFDAPGSDPEELKRRLEPAVARLGQSG